MNSHVINGWCFLGVLVLMRSQSLFETLKLLLSILIVGAGIGLITSVISSIFVLCIKEVGSFRESFTVKLLDIPGTSYSLQPVLWLLAAALFLALVRRLFKLERWHGPADSIYAAHRTDNELDLRAGVGSTVAAFISLCGGAPVGQYGPLVHFGATIGSSIFGFLNNQKITADVFIGCGAAAAIAAGFHAPIAGIVFAHEAILRHFSFRAITPIAIASITSSWFSSLVFGGEPLFQINFSLPDLFPLVPTLLSSGIFFGLIAIIFMKSLLFFSKIAAQTNFSPLFLVVLAALFCGGVGVFLPEVLGLGIGTVDRMLANEYLILFLVLLMSAKIIASSLSIGFGLFGGVFSPALFIGASAGGVFGQMLAAIGLVAVPQIFVVSGMAAIGAAVVGAPISVVLIILELTASYELAVAAMLSVVVSTLFCSLIFGHSFFDAQLIKRGIDLSQGRGNLELMGKSVEAIVVQDYVRLSESLTVSAAIKILADANVGEGYCTDAKGVFIGKCTLQKLLHCNGEDGISVSFIKNPVLMNHDASIMQAIEIASNFFGESIPVIVKSNNRLVGVVSEAHIFQSYLTTQNRVRDLEHG